jgi:hypothetical protein
VSGEKRGNKGKTGKSGYLMIFALILKKMYNPGMKHKE